jgi:hypothetical protein
MADPGFTEERAWRESSVYAEEIPEWNAAGGPPFEIQVGSASFTTEDDENAPFTGCEYCGNEITVEEYNRTGTSESCDECIGEQPEEEE